MSDAVPEATSDTGAVRDLGAAAIDLWLGGRELYSTFVRTLYYVFRGKRDKGATLRQMYEVGNKSVFFVSITMGFIGMILVYQAGLQSKRIVPDFTMLGPTYLELLVRDFAASLAALMLATRVGAGIAAEIGSMVVTEQVDALRMCAADPIDFLLVPRFLASMVMTRCSSSGPAPSRSSRARPRPTSPSTCRCARSAGMQLIDWGDLTIGLSKCIAYGAAIPIVSGYCGLSTFGGSEGVGWATTRAVVNSSLAIIILNAIISTAGLIAFGTK